MSQREAQSAVGSRVLGSTSRTLLKGLRANESTAWDRLVTLYAPLVYHWCRREDLPDAEMGDLFQDVFQAVAMNIGRFRKDREGDTFRGWLRTITRHKIVDHFRKRAGEPRGVGGTSAHLRLATFPAPDREVEDASESAAGRELLKRGLDLIREEFEDRTWQAFWRTAVDNQEAPDVAAELGMSPGAVRVAKCRVLRRLREELGEAG